MGKVKSIAERAEDYLKSNKNVEKLYASSDNFLFTQKDLAKSHARSLEDKKVTTYGRSEKVSAPADEPKGFLEQPVAKIKASLADKKDVAELEGYIAEEKAAEDPRTTAIEALEARVAELKEKE